MFVFVSAALGHGELQCAYTGIAYTETTSQISNNLALEVSDLLICLYFPSTHFVLVLVSAIVSYLLIYLKLDYKSPVLIHVVGT